MDTPSLRDRLTRKSEVVMDKLVRDHIPELAQLESNPITFHQADPDEYRFFLEKKLLEEVHEFLENPSLEEMADIVEVLETFCKEMQTSLAQMDIVRQQKAKEKGRFSKKWIMKKELRS